jgi:hypothetical protein
MAPLDQPGGHDKAGRDGAEIANGARIFPGLEDLSNPADGVARYGPSMPPELGSLPQSPPPIETPGLHSDLTS